MFLGVEDFLEKVPICAGAKVSSATYFTFSGLIISVLTISKLNLDTV